MLKTERKSHPITCKDRIRRSNGLKKVQKSRPNQSAGYGRARLDLVHARKKWEVYSVNI